MNNFIVNAQNAIGGSWDEIVRFLTAIIILFVGWFAAKIIATIFRKAMKKATFMRRFFDIAGVQTSPDKIINIAAKILYYVILLMVVITALDVLRLDAISSTLTTIKSQYLPAFFQAGIALIIAWVLATLARLGITKVAQWSNLDEKVKTNNVSTWTNMELTKTLANTGYWAVFLFFLPQILEPLGFSQLLQPINDVINTIVGYLPNLLWAGITLAISYVVWKLLAWIIANLLKGMGFNDIFRKIGIKVDPKTEPTKVVGWLVLSFIMLFAFIEAANQLGFTQLSVIAADLLQFAWDILVWIIIIGLGSFIAMKVAEVVDATTNSALLPKLAKTAVLILAIAMGLKEMGLADDIINLAFGLSLWAVAVAAALAFGLGGKETAGRELEAWVQKQKKSVKK